MSIWVVFVIVLVVVGIFAVLKARVPTKEDGLGFEKREYLFSPAERAFLGVLEQAVDSRYRIFGKVRLGDIVKPEKGSTPSKRTTASNRINQKHVDFVICSATDLALLGVVELDDKSHARKDREQRDEFVDRALAAAGITVVHFSAQKGYSLQEVRTKLSECLAVGAVTKTDNTAQGASEPENRIAVDEQPATQTIEMQVEAVESVVPDLESSAPTCPKCSAVMVKRQATKGPHAGKHFWACSSFPKCRHLTAIAEV